MDKLKAKIYLAGNISTEPKTFCWKNDLSSMLINEFEELFDFKIFNPAITEYDKQFLSNTLNQKKKMKQNFFRARRYQLIKQCNLMVVNLILFDPERPMVGTIQELVWAHDLFYIPVIAIVENDQNVYCKHPWINECLSAKVKDVNSCKELIFNYFL